MSKAGVDRLTALDYFVEASRILDKEAFPKLLDAVEKNKPKVFESECKKLGLEEKLKIKEAEKNAK